MVTKSKPKRPQVSVRSETYELIKKEAEKRGIKVTHLLALILEDYEARERDAEM